MEGVTYLAVGYFGMVVGIGLAVAAGINTFGSNPDTWYSNTASTISGLSTSVSE